MKIQIDIDENNEEPFVTIHAKEWSEDLNALVKKIKNLDPGRIVAVDGEQSVLLQPEDIDYVFSEGRKVFAAVGKQRMELKMKLYEVEELLVSQKFQRFSKSVIGNIEHIQRFEVAFNGNLCVYFKSGNKEYVSRNYVKALKNQLMMGGH
ncbi:LytTR family DNA-binding domain-containing protein [Barrientosiimonas marina]|uniref:LytTR family DNA-binding domain-containing protein n=1 Tax=Lentibacillus kimchii TaxID=1542911 RepID=A0ABW2UTG6_9BACI